MAALHCGQRAWIERATPLSAPPQEGQRSPSSRGRGATYGARLSRAGTRQGLSQKPQRVCSSGASSGRAPERALRNGRRSP